MTVTGALTDMTVGRFNPRAGALAMHFQHVGSGTRVQSRTEMSGFRASSAFLVN
jgi:hypothetical protein